MSDNPQMDLARKFLEQTGINVFLTGKAGTGKTTFLRDLRQSSPKRMIVVAPTGVAAINAGGVTIHSFFQLPFGPHLPGVLRIGGEKRMNFSKEKIAVIRSLDLLVIDEISMVRADLLDAMNDVLRRYRDWDKPFGGVQLLMIGDLQQLAPVVKQPEWELLGKYYESPYFFDSAALREAKYITLELKHVYRQSDTGFIDILNRVRENTVTPDILERLNSRYVPGFVPDDKDGYITLTSHNDTARAINERRMAGLDTPPHTFSCDIEGDFPEYLFPTDRELTLKAGAQVMFVKNDPTGLQRYFNGKIGRITRIGESKIEVALDDLAEPVEVEPGEWTNVKYTVDPQTREISETVEGIFRQYPLRAAWAITIHKSQGLTFDRVIIDAAHSFSHGQVYVALSRCRSFEGLVLRTPLQKNAIINDSAVADFNRNMETDRPDETLFAAQRRIYYRSLLTDMFDFTSLKIKIFTVRKAFNEHLAKIYPKSTGMWNAASGRFISEIVAISEKFQYQLDALLTASSDPETDRQLTDRIVKAQSYFLAKCEEIVMPLMNQSDIVIDNKDIKKKVSEAVGKLQKAFAIKTAVLGMDHSSGFTIRNYLDTRAKAAVKDLAARRSNNKKAAAEPVSEDIENPELFERLRTWRKRCATRDGVPAYVIMQQIALVTVCRVLPRSEKELSDIKGIGKVFMAKYGPQVLSIVRDWLDGKTEGETD